jgi:hypothetical protein
MVHSMRKSLEADNEYKPDWVSAEAWREWTRAWAAPEFQAQRERGRKNRRRGDPTGVAEVTHTGGSVSARRTRRILVYT